MTVSPTSQSWGPVVIGNKGGQKIITLTNGNAAAITISSISFSGTNPGDFSLFSKTCGSTLAAGASCTANIIFGPTATGTRTATLNFYDSDSSSPQKVAVSGLGTSGVSVSPTSLTFASTAVGSTSSALSASLKNGLGSSITVSSVAISGTNATDFAISGSTCGTSLAAGASCAASVVFKPSGAGTRSATLRFTDSASNSPQSVALAGTGASAAGNATASPTSITWGPVAIGNKGGQKVVTLTNGSASPLTIGSLTFSGANPGDFSIFTKTCGASLAASTSCTVNLLFGPTANGTRTATFSFNDSGGNSPQNVALSGTGGTGMTISPVSPTVPVSGSLQFTASLAATWKASCGLITTGGLFTAPATATSCTVTATATDGSGRTASTVATVAASPIIVTPAAVNLHALNTQTFTASQSVTWSASCGTITSSGVYTAPATAATCSVTAKASSGTAFTTSATVHVDVANYTARKGGGGQVGAITNELALTPSKVNANSFGLSWTANVDGWVNAQPLYMNALTINGGPHNVVFVVTDNDSVYALDGGTGAQFWHVSLIPAGETAVISSTINYPGAPKIGILSTPVIDPATNTMYVVSETSGQNATQFPHRLHALDLATGSEKFGGPVLVNDPLMAPIHKMQRTGLLLANGTVYVGIGSMQDLDPYHGLLFAFDARTLAQKAVFNSTPTGSEGGIWMGSAAPSVDVNGNIYVTTGNGTVDGTANFGNSAVKLSSGLQPLDYFAPYNSATQNAADLDLGSGSVLVVPDQPGSHPHELVVCGKSTAVYVLDRDNLGRLGTTSDNIIQRLDNQVGALSGTATTVQACLTGPVMWGQNVYFGGKYDVLKMFKLDPNTGLLSSTPVSKGTLAYGYPGADPVVSSNGASNGILWTIDTKTSALIASDATNLANTLFSGALPVPAIKWTVPTVVNGHVYVGEEGQVFGFALK